LSTGFDLRQKYPDRIWTESDSFTKAEYPVNLVIAADTNSRETEE